MVWVALIARAIPTSCSAAMLRCALELKPYAVGHHQLARDSTPRMLATPRTRYFAQLLEKDYLEDCDPARARFRVSVRNFLCKEREKSRTWKRGGRATVVSLDADAEGRYLDEPVDRLTPEDVLNAAGR